MAWARVARALIVAGLLVTVAAAAAPAPDRLAVRYVTEATPVEATVDRSPAAVMPSARLSDAGQSVVATAAADGRHVASFDATRPEAFDYVDGTPSFGHGQYLVDYRGQTYTVTTRRVDPVSPLERLAAGLTALAEAFGRVLVALGLASFGLDRWTIDTPPNGPTVG